MPEPCPQITRLAHGGSAREGVARIKRFSEIRAAPTDGDRMPRGSWVASPTVYGLPNVWETTELLAHEPLRDPFIPYCVRRSPTR